MQCPKCKIEELQKSEHNSSYFCKKCQGMWLLDVELPDYSEISSEDHSAQATSSDHDQVTGICPSGHGIMIRAKVDLPEPFYLEKCITCGGIWFDKGEAQRIDGSIFLENLSELWSRAWQHKQRKEKSRQSFLQINQRLLGDDAFQAVMKLALQLKDHPEKSRAMALLQQELLGGEDH
jgi:Zn-finger nucleic acid-binding protein